MLSTRYLIVGGGMTADAAVKGIREHDTHDRVTLVGAEPHRPYKRPPLTKKLWSGGDEEKIWLSAAEDDADLRLGTRIVGLDLEALRATDDRGEEYAYEMLLLATGGTPRRLGGDDQDVIYFRTLEDYRRLRELAREGARIVVIGGGFIGSELAAALTGVGAQVTMVFPEAGIAARVLPATLARFVSDYYGEHGVDVLAGETVASVDGTRVTLGSGHLPFFYSDLFDLGYEAVGDVDSRLATVETWHEPNRKGTVVYVDDDGRPRGVLLWNVWDKVDAARELIRAGEPVGEGAIV